MRSTRGRTCATICRYALYIAAALANAGFLDNFARADSVPVYQFDIAAQPLGQSLRDLSASAAQQIIFSEDIVRGLNAPALHGSYTRDQALNVLLKGTELKAEYTKTDTIMVIRKEAGAGHKPAMTNTAGARENPSEDKPPNPTQAVAVEKTPAASRSDNPRSGGVEEIIVTAQRRAENVLAVPLSVQAFSGERLNQLGIKRLNDLQFTTPGYLPIDSSGVTEIFIRGVGSTVLTGADPSVATFVDDVPHVWGNTSGNLVDVERVEVLKGAQGGLYGRNATGGVVNIITRQPNTEKFEGNLQVGYGEKKTFRAAGYANFPITDRVALMVAAERDSHGPYIKNIAQANPFTAAMFPNGSFLGSPQQTANIFNSTVHPPSGIGNQDFWATDQKLLLKFSDNFKITLVGDYSDQADSSGAETVNLTPAYTQAFETGFFGAFGINAQLPPGFEQGSSGHKFTTSLGYPAYVYIREMGLSATAVWNLPNFDLTSISAYRRQRYTFNGGASAGAIPAINFFTNQHRNYFYQELRAASTWNGRFHFLGVGTFLVDNYDGRPAPVIALFQLFYGGQYRSLGTVHNWSVYAQGTYDVTDRLGITVSGRFVRETNHALFTFPTVSAINSSEKKFLPSATLSYRVEDGNIYARWARGFKAGGINPSAAPSLFPDPRDGSVFGPEQVDTYEVGYRQALLDHRVRLTTAAFYNDYKGLQVTATANPQYAATIDYAIVNGGSARTWGAEGSLNVRVIDPLTLGIAAGYLNAKYTNFVLQNNPVLSNFNLTGQTMLDSPKFQVTFTGDLEQPLNDSLQLIAHVIVAHISKVELTQSGLPGILPPIYCPAYWLTNVRAGIQTTDGKYSFSVYANNLFNTAYYSFGSSSSVGNLADWGHPRIVGAEIGMKF